MTASPLTQTELTRLIKEKALALGFAKVGIVPAEPFRNGAVERLQTWLSQGFQADMAWMVSHYDKRKDPASLMEGTRSIVCVALNYFNTDAYDSQDAKELKIAKYARGTDYHYVVKDRLKELLAYVQTLQPDVQGRALTDSAPIMEKPLAVQAGLGWMGKNGNLILPGMGSFFFLGELLLDVALDYDTTVVPDQCGSCRRCIEACPTEAIVEPTVVDANRCIAYWTIEYKGEQFPATIREHLNGWVFGCDICQDVCPWNIKFARPTEEAAFQPRSLTRHPHRETLMALDEEQFREAFRKSPIKRPKLAGLQRNVRMATE
ncbi:tRNA epoxyqueuosine(34) reductase QueG [Vampirovibrio chlorellavorus]|uniref:tRNA epoxyqueuosine(34) reductase QueG n=1 Tax=Vampirovibrio chlorellavorus TaxID=758823 RepID=UPI0026ECBA50|nr:tRNA epoxyqueuosine(34) reductase QueG [Vampirovibrio chlorellavorus]